MIDPIKVASPANWHLHGIFTGPCWPNLTEAMCPHFLPRSFSLRSCFRGMVTGLWINKTSHVAIWRERRVLP